MSSDAMIKNTKAYADLSQVPLHCTCQRIQLADFGPFFHYEAEIEVKVKSQRKRAPPYSFREVDFIKAKYFLLSWDPFPFHRKIILHAVFVLHYRSNAPLYSTGFWLDKRWHFALSARCTTDWISRIHLVAPPENCKRRIRDVHGRFSY